MRFLFILLIGFISYPISAQTWQDLQLKAQKLYETGQFTQSISIGKKAKNIADKNSANFRKLPYGRLLTFLGLSYQATSNLDSALIFHQFSTNIALKYYGNTHYLYGSRLVNVGITLRYLEKPKEAQEALEKALPVVAKNWGKNNDIYRNGIIHCAKACVANEDYEKAEFYYLETEKLYAAQKLQFPASASIDLANLYHSQERYEEVIDYLEKSFLDISEQPEHHKASILNIMNALSIHYAKERDYQKLWSLFELCEKRKVEGRIIFLEDFFNQTLDDADFKETDEIIQKWKTYSDLFNQSEHAREYITKNNLKRILEKYDSAQIGKVFEVIDFQADNKVNIFQTELKANFFYQNENYDLAIDLLREVLEFKESAEPDFSMFQVWEEHLILKLRIQRALRFTENYEESCELLIEIISNIFHPNNDDRRNFFFQENSRNEFIVLEEFNEWMTDEKLWNAGKSLMKQEFRRMSADYEILSQYLLRYGFNKGANRLRKELR